MERKTFKQSVVVIFFHLVFYALSISGVSVCRAEEIHPDVVVDQNKVSRPPSNSAFHGSLPSHFGQAAKDLVSPNSNSACPCACPCAWMILGAGSLASIGSYFFLDTKVKNFFSGQNRLGNAAWLGNELLGTGVPGVLSGLGFLGYGFFFQNSLAHESGRAQLEGLFTTFVFTTALKFSVRRTRPESQNRHSFPSAHASTVFSSAGSLWGMHGPWVGLPVVVLGAYTGLCRLSSNSHHLSDVLFGATLGFVFGYIFSLHHRNQTRDQIGGEKIQASLLLQGLQSHEAALGAQVGWSF